MWTLWLIFVFLSKGDFFLAITDVNMHSKIIKRCSFGAGYLNSRPRNFMFLIRTPPTLLLVTSLSNNDHYVSIYYKVTDVFSKRKKTLFFVFFLLSLWIWYNYCTFLKNVSLDFYVQSSLYYWSDFVYRLLMCKLGKIFHKLNNIRHE